MSRLTRLPGRSLAGLIAGALLLPGLLPSAAQEATPPAQSSQPAPPKAPPAPAAETPKPVAEESEPAEPVEEERVPEERVSADNNLSFPVDI